MSDAPERPEPQPDGEHHPVPVVRQLGWLQVPAGKACEACSVARNVLVMWPCAVVQMEPISTAELDDELRELLGNKE